jgi:hypothetical protein
MERVISMIKGSTLVGRGSRMTQRVGEALRVDLRTCDERPSVRRAVTQRVATQFDASQGPTLQPVWFSLRRWRILGQTARRSFGLTNQSTDNTN